MLFLEHNVCDSVVVLFWIALIKFFFHNNKAFKIDFNEDCSSFSISKLPFYRERHYRKNKEVVNIL